MNILSYNPAHDGAIAYLRDARLRFSIEAEKNSNYRYSPISSHDVFNVLGEVDEMPDVICTGGWWPREEHLLGALLRAALSAQFGGSDRVRTFRRLTNPRFFHGKSDLQHELSIPQTGETLSRFAG